MPPLDELMLDNLFFDTCVYHQAGIDLLMRVVRQGTSLRLGADRRGQGIDPESGHFFDDTRRYVDAAQLGTDREAIFHDNAMRGSPDSASAIPSFGRVVGVDSARAGRRRARSPATSLSLVS